MTSSLAMTFSGQELRYIWRFSQPRLTPSMTPDPLYYLANFMEAIDWVAERNRDQLDADELAFAETFTGLPVPAQAFLVRLIMRRGDLFRRSRINYPEIGDLDGALASLLKLSWIDSEPGIALDDLFRFATRKNLPCIFLSCAHAPRSGSLPAAFGTAYRCRHVRPMDGDAGAGLSRADCLNDHALQIVVFRNVSSGVV